MRATGNRFWRHLITDETDARRIFPSESLDRIERAIAAGEATHSGQVCVAIESALPLRRVVKKLAPRDRALEVFAQTRVWDTAHNNGVLVYLLLADRDVEIVADRGIHARVGEVAWESICQRMEQAFREGRFAEGLESGVREVSALIAMHFPGGADDANELPNPPVVI